MQSDYKQQLRNAVLEYLSPEAYEARLGNSADMVTRDQANSRYLANAVRQGAKDHPRRKIVQNQAPIKGRWQARNQIDDLSKTRSDRVSKVKQGRRGGGNSKLQRKGFDDNRAVGPNKPRPATLKLGKTLGIEEQFRNSILNYLEEGMKTGDNPAETGAMTGRYLRRLKYSVNKGETNPEVLRRKNAQAERIKKKIGDRAGGREGYDDLAKEPDLNRAFAKDQFTDAKFGGEGKGTDEYPDKDARAPENAPNPTDIKRRAAGIAPYRQRSAIDPEIRKGQIIRPNRPRNAPSSRPKTVRYDPTEENNDTTKRREQFKNAVLNYLDEWTAEGVMKAAKKRGYHPDGDDDETGNTRDVNSRHDAGKTTRVTKNDDGTVTVDRSDASKYERDSKGKTIKGKYKRRSRSAAITKKVIKP